MSQLKLTADSGGGTVAIKGPASTTGNGAIELTVPGTGNATLLTNATSTGKILQVVSTHKVDAFATTSSSFVDITGLSRTITPTAASSKINIIISVHVGGDDSSYVGFKLLRGSTVVTQGTNGTGNMTNCSFGGYIPSDHTTETFGYTFLDSPSYNVGDTLTYKIQMVSAHNNKNVCINKNHSGSNAAYTINGTSTITLMEVAA